MAKGKGGKKGAWEEITTNYLVCDDWGLALRVSGAREAATDEAVAAAARKAWAVAQTAAAEGEEAKAAAEAARRAWREAAAKEMGKLNN